MVANAYGSVVSMAFMVLDTGREPLQTWARTGYATGKYGLGSRHGHTQ